VALSTTTNRRTANGSTEASSNVNSMASTAEEMTASVREISHQVQERRAWRAMPTGKATGEIGQQISGIQSATQESVAAIDQIRNSIEKLSGISSAIASAIASAIEEQGATTQEVAATCSTPPGARRKSPRMSVISSAERRKPELPRPMWCPPRKRCRATVHGSRPRSTTS
jgi:hypothetical protein